MKEKKFRLSLAKTLRNISFFMVLFIFTNIFYYSSYSYTNNTKNKHVQENEKIEIVYTK